MQLSKLFSSARTATPADLFTQLFSNHPLFWGLDSRQLAQFFAAGHVRKLRAEDQVFAPGSEGQALYLILSGEVQVQVEDQTMSLGAGESLGETGAVGQVPRGAGARMIQDGILLALLHEDLLHLGKREAALMRSFWMNLSTVLARRLVQP